jgi:hypothetical protein
MDGTKLYEINRGHYVIQTTGEIYTISCRGERQIKDELKYGTYEVVLRGGCSMSGDGWMLKGERLQFINVSAKASHIQVRLFNLTDMIPEEKYLEYIWMKRTLIMIIMRWLITSHGQTFY